MKMKAMGMSMINRLSWLVQGKARTQSLQSNPGFWKGGQRYLLD